MRVRGLVWLAIGAVVFALPYVGGPNFVIRGTHYSWGILGMVVGVGFIVYDAVTRKKEV
jgi:hypothetical protein